MSRTAVAYSAALANSSIADPTGTSVSSGAGNGGQIAAPSVAEQTLLRVVATTAGNFTMKAGSLPSAIAANVGDLVVAVGTSSTVFVGPFESGRFQQSDGSLIFETSQTMVVTAFKVPRH